MKLLLLGSGGREHALAWKIAQSPKIEKLYIAPGNAGTSEVGENVAIKADDFAAIKEFVVKNDINMVVVGPEDPLVKGIYDYFKNDEALKNVPVIGPSKAGAVLEGSKEFAKGFMQRHHIPTAGYKSITAANLEEGLAFLETLEAPYVLKADGLCAGKGVLILPTLEEAKKELKEKKKNGPVYPSVAYELGAQISERTGQEIRVTVPGHMQRGGEPCPYDRVIATRLGAEAAEMIRRKEYGYMVALNNNKIEKIPLADIAGKLKMVDPKSDIIREAKDVGISFGDE